MMDEYGLSIEEIKVFTDTNELAGDGLCQDCKGSMVCSRCDGSKTIEHDCGCELCQADEEECHECEGSGECGCAKPETRPMKTIHCIRFRKSAFYIACESDTEARHKREALRSYGQEYLAIMFKVGAA